MVKNMPAGQLLRVMEMGYARSLGVNCTHCHVPDKWESEEKPAKQKFLIEVIELYKTLPALWKIKSEEYSNREKKSRSIRKTAEKIQDAFH